MLYRLAIGGKYTGSDGAYLQYPATNRRVVKWLKKTRQKNRHMSAVFFTLIFSLTGLPLSGMGMHMPGKLPKNAYDIINIQEKPSNRRRLKVLGKNNGQITKSTVHIQLTQNCLHP